MLIYHFRIISEEHEDFLREIQIQPKQNFLDFHINLVESTELLHCERASFFLTDKKYKKGVEITLKTEKRIVRKYDEDLDQVVTESITLPLMKHAKLNQYIEDPHQKMIYEFVGRDRFSFLIELFRILKTDDIHSYPRCVKRVGELPKKAEQPVPPAPKPISTKIPIPKIPLPEVEESTKLNDIVENESELAAIENDISAFIEEETTNQEVIPPAMDEDEGFSFEEEEAMGHIEDYDDLDSIDKPYSGFDQNSDDY
ncbi:MAG: hypothetical protein M0P58_00355 [Bacteroidales bacterium]|nr:hypothetical protein [Bacteroidales bacterium]